MRYFSSVFLMLILSNSLCAFTQPKQKKQPVPVIFDSDMGPDYDDAGAIAMLHAFADEGSARILATMASTKYEGVAGVLNVFNTYFGRPAIPVGVPRGKALELKDRQHWTDTLLANYAHHIGTNTQAEDAIILYRKILAAQPDKTVTIITVGFLTNLAALLQSPPDKYSSLSGTLLVKKKVKQLVCMAGGFPSGSEFNVDSDADASRIVFDGWPTAVLLSGFEIGNKIKAGLPLINNKLIKKNPVKDVFRISIPLDPQDAGGRMSWDETAVLIAVKGTDPWYNIVKGKMVVADDGSNTWSVASSEHAYIVEKESPKLVEELINQLIMHQPAKMKKR